MRTSKPFILEPSRQVAREPCKQKKAPALPDETVVVPGHGPLTTIGEERESNPFLKQ